MRQLNGNKHYQDKFEYNDKGSMATVGRNLAVVDIPHPKIHFGGFVAWLVWMGLHLLLILGVKTGCRSSSIGFINTSPTTKACDCCSGLLQTGEIKVAFLP